MARKISEEQQSTPSMRLDTHEAVNETLVYAHGLVAHLSDCLKARYAHLIEPPRYVNSAVSWTIDGDTMREARSIERTMHRLAVQAGRIARMRSEAQADRDEIARYALVMRSYVARLVQIDPDASMAYVPRAYDESGAMGGGHGCDERTKAQRIRTASGERAERIRHNVREVKDNDLKQADYACAGSVAYGDILALANESAAL